MSMNRLDDDTELKEAKYPTVQVMETESGHISVWSDTSGATYILHAHQSGSYQLFSHDGKRVNFSVGDTQDYHKSGLSVTVDENSDVKINGHQRVIVGGGSFVEVKGDAGIGVAGDVGIFAGGSLSVNADDVYLGARGNLNMNVKGDLNMNVEGNKTSTVQGETTEASAGDHTIVGSNIKLNP